MKHKITFFCVIFLSLTYYWLKADVLFYFAQALQSLIPEPSIDLILLEEIKKLPQAPIDYPMAQSFTSKLFLKTSELCISALKNHSLKAQWFEGGTKGFDNWKLYPRQIPVS